MTMTVPRGFRQARACGLAESALLKLETAVNDAAVQVQHHERLMKAPRFATSLEIAARLGGLESELSNEVEERAGAALVGNEHLDALPGEVPRQCMAERS